MVVQVVVSCFFLFLSIQNQIQISFSFWLIYYNLRYSYQADDPDTTKQITYVIKQGNTDLFSIDPKTGVIKTIRGLDYERDNQHILIIGTLENNSNLPGSTTRVIINVQVISDKMKCTCASALDWEATKRSKSNKVCFSHFSFLLSIQIFMFHQ